MSRVLLDTHALLWMVSGDDRLSDAARSAILAAGNQLLFSVAGYWELCIKIDLGKLELQKNWERHLDNELKSNDIQMLNIYPEHCRALCKLPWIHRDPFDRLIIAQCRVESAALLSADSVLSRYPGVKVMW
jgi:PIN domain nuclease of toxin-antitoxin system